MNSVTAHHLVSPSLRMLPGDTQHSATRYLTLSRMSNHLIASKSGQTLSRSDTSIFKDNTLRRL